MQLCVHQVSVERRMCKACAKSSLLNTRVPGSQRPGPRRTPPQLSEAPGPPRSSDAFVPR